MILDDIQNPSVIKNMSVKELDELCEEIRRFLISSISRTGGHLASNLGVVELTVALHYVFDSPNDKIFFDVGHQCYTHKILTGRAGGFSALRQYKGMSGFQKRAESRHDVWEAGHSSTSLSAALGMAVARDLDGKDYAVVPVIGDGALSSGMALEALNHIGAEKRKLIIVFNDNNMSISRNVGALNHAFSRLRASNGYIRVKNNMKRNLRSSSVGEIVYTSLKAVKDSVKEALINGGIFEEFGLDYIGPVDGHNLSDLIRVLTVAKASDGPIVVHVLTTKGKGYGPCEKDREGVWHGVGPFDPKTGKALHHTAAGMISWSRQVALAAKDLAAKDERIIAITPAMIYGSSLQEFFAAYPERSFDVGIAEEHAATFAASLAMAGKRPLLFIYSSFLQRCYDQVNHDICRMNLPVTLCIDRAGLVGEDGDTHHGVFDIGILMPLPNLILSAPKDAEEACALLETSLGQTHPFAIRFAKGEIQQAKGKAEPVEIGTWPVFNDAPDHRIAILTYGSSVDEILERVQENSLPVTVVNCRFFKPMDEECLVSLLERGMKLISYETDMLDGGLGEHIDAWLNDHGFDAHLERFGIESRYVGQGRLPQLKREVRIDYSRLFSTVDKWLKEV